MASEVALGSQEKSFLPPAPRRPTWSRVQPVYAKHTDLALEQGPMTEGEHRTLLLATAPTLRETLEPRSPLITPPCDRLTPVERDRSEVSPIPDTV